MNSALQCPKCRAPLTAAHLNRADLLPCLACGTPLQVEVFPALFRRINPGRDGEVLVVETQASCFYHPQKKAVVPCELCGRFLCALCDCELHGQHLCPACLEAGRQKGKIKKLENTRTLYDSVAFGLALYPVLFVYPTIVTAPLAVIFALRYWNAPRSIVHRTRLRLFLALILASLQIVGWIVGIYFLAFKTKHG